MVYFTCDACGEQLKKPSVEKHYTQKCRDCYKLTCIDCMKDFYGDEYQSHTSCMSEDQRYSKEGRGGWDPSKGQGHKGEKKQNAWVSNLRSILAEADGLDSDVKTIVNTIMDHENIPRKKPKFVNFVKNIMRNKARPHSIDKTWDLFSQALKAPEAESETKMEISEEKLANCDKEIEVETKAKEKKKKKKSKDVESSEDVSNDSKKKKKMKATVETGSEETSEKENVEVKSKKKKKKEKEEAELEQQSLKRKRDEDMEVEEDEETSAKKKKKKFDWDETISNVLMRKEGNEMKLNKLKKKCISEFMSQNEGTHLTAEEIGAKFDKKLKKKKYRVLKDKVKLCLDSEEAPSEQSATVEEKCEPVQPVQQPQASFNNWESANLGSSTQNEKFRRLMGIKSTNKEAKGMFGVQARNDQKIFRDLEEGFERARQTHFGGRCFET